MLLNAKLYKSRSGFPTIFSLMREKNDNGTSQQKQKIVCFACMEDVIGIILGSCDCGSDYKSFSVVCWMFNRCIVRNFPNAAGMFANPVKSLMKRWGVFPNHMSTFLSYERNLKLFKKKDIIKRMICMPVMCEEKRSEYLKYNIISPSYLHSDKDVVNLFLDSVSCNRFDKVNEFFMKSAHYITEQVVMDLFMNVHKRRFVLRSDLIRNAIIEGVLSYNFVCTIIEHGRLDYTYLECHRDHTIHCNKFINNKYFYEGSLGDYIRCCYVSGEDVLDVWKKSILSKDLYIDHFKSATYEITVHIFLESLDFCIELKYFLNVLLPMINLDETLKISVIKSALKHCHYEWTEILQFEDLIPKSTLLDTFCLRQ